MQLYVYNQDVVRGQTIYEQGKSYRAWDHQIDSFYNTKEYEIWYTLVGIVQVHYYDEIDGSLVITEGEEPHLFSELTKTVPVFTIAETSALLSLSRQRIQQLIGENALPAKKREGIYLLAGMDILAFSLKERPSGRPASQAEEASPPDAGGLASSAWYWILSREKRVVILCSIPQRETHCFPS